MVHYILPVILSWAALKAQILHIRVVQCLYVPWASPPLVSELLIGRASLGESLLRA